MKHKNTKYRRKRSFYCEYDWCRVFIYCKVWELCDGGDENSEKVGEQIEI